MSTTSISNTGQAVQKRFIQIGIYFTALALILFLSAGRIDWGWAWAYLGAGVVILIVNAFVMPRELIAERAAPKDNVKGWDKVISWLTLVPTLGLLLTAGLDERYEWSSPLGVSINFLGLTMMMLGNGLVTWAMVSNNFFSTVVRIQTDRGHQVATAGPYHYVRHPGYVGFILTNLSAPLILDSPWALICAVLIVSLFIVRTALEDRTLQNELPGYKDYSAQVRYRLLPGVW